MTLAGFGGASPLLMMLVFSLIFGKLMPREDIRQYAVFFLVGLLPWQFFFGYQNDPAAEPFALADKFNAFKIAGEA